MATEVINGTRTAANTTENMIFTGPGVLYGVFPELTTTGTITIRDTATAAAGAAKHVCAIGLTQAGKKFDAGSAGGVFFEFGCSVQLSVGTDLSLITWRKLP